MVCTYAPADWPTGVGLSQWRRNRKVLTFTGEHNIAELVYTHGDA